MLRAILLGVLSISSVVACKSGGDSAKSQPGVAAGKVIEVKGAVTIKHGDAARPLVAGESVEGDDTVVTGADGNVVIELAHNLVRWELGPNKTQKVRESIAWKAAKSTGPAGEVDQDTAAAGRPAERSAAGTTATEIEGADEKKADAEPAAAAPAAAPAVAEEMAKGGAPAAEERERAPVRPARTRVRRESAKAAAAPAPPPPPADEVASDDDAEPVRRTRGATRGPVIAKPTPESMNAPRAASAAPSGGGAAPPPGGAATSATAGPTVASLVAQKQGALKGCLAGHKDPVQLIVIVSGGSPAVKMSSKTAVTAALEACMKKVIGTISFGADGKVSTEIKP